MKTKPFVFGTQDAWEEFWIAKKNVSKRRWRATTAQPNHPRWFRALGANLQHTWQPVKKPAKSYFGSFCRSLQVLSQVLLQVGTGFFTGCQVCCRFAKRAPNHMGWFGWHQYIGNVFHKRGFSRTDPRNSCPARKGVCCFYPQTIWNHKFVQNSERSCRGKGHHQNDANKNTVEPAEQEAITAMYKLVPGMELLQQKIDVFLEGKESHFEDVEDLGDGLQELEENQQGILDTIEDSSNALREKADKIVSTTNASKAVAYSLLKVVGIVVELLGTVALLGLVAWNSHSSQVS